MSLIMAGFTVTAVRDEVLFNLPWRPVLIVLSMIGTVVGLGVVIRGREAATVGWVGLIWMLYATIRGGAWLTKDSWTGFVAWLPAFLLGMVVFARRRQNPDRRPDEGRPA
jgi:hypothetical protein